MEFKRLFLIVFLTACFTCKQKNKTADEWNRIRPDPIVGGPDSDKAQIVFIEFRKLDGYTDKEMIRDLQEWLISGSILSNAFQVDPYRAAFVFNDEESAEFAANEISRLKECLVVEYQKARIFGKYSSIKERK